MLVVYPARVQDDLLSRHGHWIKTDQLLRSELLTGLSSWFLEVLYDCRNLQVQCTMKQQFSVPYCFIFLDISFVWSRQGSICIFIGNYSWGYLRTLTTLKGLLTALYNTLLWSVLVFLGSVGWSEGCAALFEQPQYPHHAQEGGECVIYSHQWWFPIAGAGMWASTAQTNNVPSEMPPSNMFSFWVLWTVYCKPS